MRVMLTELTRIQSHLVWLGTHALDIGAMTVFFYCFREREDILRIFEMFSGQRMMTSYIRPGGLALEPPRGWEKAVRKFNDALPGRVDQYENLLNANPIWTRRTQGVGFISLEDMLDLRVTGPMLRGAAARAHAAQPQHNIHCPDPSRHIKTSAQRPDTSGGRPPASAAGKGEGEKKLATRPATSRPKPRTTPPPQEPPPPPHPPPPS